LTGFDDVIEKKESPAEQPVKSALIHQGGDNTAPYPVSRMAPAIELVDLAREIERADQQITGLTNAKLDLVAQQIRQLQQQARDILEKAEQDQKLHRASCAFQRRPGEIYHLYQASMQRQYFSMLAPHEWGVRAPHQYIGSYRLELDSSWTECSL